VIDRRAARGAFRVHRIEIAPQLPDGGVERLQAPGGTRLHHRSFHHDKNEAGQLARVGAGGEAAGSRRQPRRDSCAPVPEILVDLFSQSGIAVPDLEREVPDGAAEGTARDLEPFAVHVEKRENPFDRIVRRGFRLFEDVRSKSIDVFVEDRSEQILLARKEVVQAAAVDLGFAQDRGSLPALAYPAFRPAYVLRRNFAAGPVSSRSSISSDSAAV
jgi:hypothetical protein